MTEKRPPGDESQLPGVRETGRSGGQRPEKKLRRVSQRRELAVVTLGAVAAMTGLGGYLAAYPPDNAAQAAPPPETAPLLEAAPPETTETGTTAPAGTGRDGAAREGERTQRSATDAAPVPEQTPQAPVQQAPPVYSAPSEVPAAAESRGS